SPCSSTASAGKSSSTPAPRATAPSRATAGPIASGRPCVTTAARRTALGDGVGNPAFELIGHPRRVGMDEVEKELPVPLRPGQAGVYDPADARTPGRGRGGDLAEDAPPDVRVANDP